MSITHRGRKAAAFALTFALTATASTSALACACGCGVFGVGANALLSSGSRGQLFIEYDRSDQDQNFSGVSRAPADDNEDKRIKTDFFTVGGRYTLNRDWSVLAELPYWNRTFTTEADDDGGLATYKHGGVGDVRLQAIYTGLTSSRTTGITLGVKLPTGDFKTPGFDRDTEIGTGSTDLLLGAYHFGALPRQTAVTYFVQAAVDVPVATQGGYEPGVDVNAVAGLYYGGLTALKGRLRITPVLQVVGSQRARDAGIEADRQGTGYTRVLVSPGVELAAGGWRLYGDVELPVYEHYNGNQLAAAHLFKATLTRAF